jgi:PAS domain S-box-containing protein
MNAPRQLARVAQAFADSETIERNHQAEACCPNCQSTQSCRDVAETAGVVLRLKQKSLKQSDALFERLCTCAPISIFLTNAAGRCIYANPYLQATTGLALQESLEFAWGNAVQPGNPQGVMARSSPMAGEGGELSPEFPLENLQGETRWVRVRTVTMLFADGSHVGRLGIVEDITERKRAEEALKNATLETLKALSQVIEANDPYTAGHSARVTEIALRIASEMSLGEDQLDILHIAGLLHDLGKVGIPESVLNKPSKLTRVEWLMIQAHPVISAQTAEQVTAFRAAVPAIRHHHERWDGTGYPDRLAGESIPLLARILAVADSFEAMTSRRAYRRARTQEEAVAELARGAGSQWDPATVDAFLRTLHGKSLAL